MCNSQLPNARCCHGNHEIKGEYFHLLIISNTPMLIFKLKLPKKNLQTYPALFICSVFLVLVLCSSPCPIFFSCSSSCSFLFLLSSLLLFLALFFLSVFLFLILISFLLLFMSMFLVFLSLSLCLIFIFHCLFPCPSP